MNLTQIQITAMKNIFPFTLRIDHRIKIFLLFVSGIFFGLSAFAQNGTWTWMSGDSTHFGNAVNGTMGVPAPGNKPYSLYESCQWTDLNGRLWIFGGIDAGGNDHSEMWRFDPSNNMWTWMSGNSIPQGLYGVRGVPSPGNYPGPRGWGAASWTDLQGNLWMFGGTGYDINGQYGTLSDLWKYNVVTNEWTWMNGFPTVYTQGSYGTILVPDSSNKPWPRWENIANWVDASGNLWMYGGLGSYDYNSQYGYCFNDMWKYNPSTNMWTWMSGNMGAGNFPASYGTQNIPSPTNTPGSRSSCSKWKDLNGDFWIYGGLTFTGFPAFADMWKYNTTTNQWTWVGGTNAVNAQNTFTVQHVPGNGMPGGRYESRCNWTDACGRFWSFGGFVQFSYPDAWNDLWMYNPSTNLFSWEGGQNTPWGFGSYGNYQIPAANNYPDARGGAPGFKDTTGYVWLFGGWAVMGYRGSSNALWKYEPYPDSCSSATTGIIHSAENSFMVYPNPSSGTTYIQISDKINLVGLIVKVYDASGKCVERKTDLQSNILEINLDASGLYCVSLENVAGERLGIVRIINSK
ncbi:hypothetical protein BH09BAC5_BH09BAC5_06510 [soil metagenome]